MWQGASPDSMGFLRFDGVGETGETQRAPCTQSAGRFDGKLTSMFVGVILGEENVGHVLTGHTALIVNEAGELPVGLSLVGHTVKVSGGF